MSNKDKGDNMTLTVSEKDYVFTGTPLPLQHWNLTWLQEMVEKAFIGRPKKIAEARKIFEEYRNK